VRRGEGWRSARVLAPASLLVAVALLAPRSALAQTLRAEAFPRAGAPAGEGPARVPLVHRPWIRPIASLLVPGSGQLLGGHSRGILFMAAEVWIVARAAAAHGEGRSQARVFRNLAFEVARRPFTTQRLDGPWDYYEAMASWAESGTFDTDPGPSLVPEGDTTTFNGHLWRLAEETYFANPDSVPAPDSPAFLAAVAFYRQHAVTDSFRWSWRNARLEQDVYRNTIHASDAAYQETTNWLGALVLNHLASGIDAFVTLRLGHRPRALPRVVFSADPQAVQLTWEAPVRLTP